MKTPDFRALCAELADALDYHQQQTRPIFRSQEMLACARAALAVEAVGPSDEAQASFTAWFCRNYPGPDTIICRPEWHAPKVFRAAADAIARWGRPADAPRPIPVAERLPGAGDCDAQGRCWRYIGPEESMGNPMWELARSKYVGATYGSVAWLPASALPAPEQEGADG